MSSTVHRDTDPRDTSARCRRELIASGGGDGWKPSGSFSPLRPGQQPRAVRAAARDATGALERTGPRRWGGRDRRRQARRCRDLSRQDLEALLQKALHDDIEKKRFAGIGLGWRGIGGKRAWRRTYDQREPGTKRSAVQSPVRSPCRCRAAGSSCLPPWRDRSR